MDGNHLLQMKFSDSEVSSLEQDLHMVGDTQNTPAGNLAFGSDLNSRNNTYEVAPLQSNLQSILGFMSARPCCGHDRIDELACRGNGDEQLGGIPELPPYQECDPRVLFNNLVFLEQKVHDLEGVVKSMIQERCNSNQTARGASFLTRQQMVVTEIASIIIQAISTAGRLLHLGQERVQGSLCTTEIYPVISTLSDLLGVPMGLGAWNLQKIGIQGSAIGTDMIVGNHSAKGSEGNYDNNQVEKPMHAVQEAEPDSATDLVFSEILKDNEDGEGKDLGFPGYDVLELEKEEILAPHTHFCLICDKGFKRDANLRMHMRGHGDIFKTPEALANPNKAAKLNFVRPRRYSCPFDGCKRNQKHKKFQPLKTILCVKNHYKRSHCNKSYICSRCNSKKFSVIADLKTHEKHCGNDKWICSCGTTFSRKDKLFGHVALFHGHTPVFPLQENKGCGIKDEITKTERRNASVSTGLETLKCNVVEFNANVVGQQASVPGSASSADLSNQAGNDQSILANTDFLVEENKNNFHIGSLETPGSPSPFMGGPFSFESLLQCGFIEPDEDNSRL